jgi:hypothetical protein
MTDPTETLQNFVSLITSIEDEWKLLADNINKTELEIIDIEHEIELSNFNAQKGYMLAKEIQTVRRERRTWKNYREIMGPLKQFADAHKQLEITMWKVLKGMREAKQTQQARVYTPRVRKDEVT